MKKYFNKIKTGLVAFWLALISFPLKVKGLEKIWDVPAQADYGIYLPKESYFEPTGTIVDIIIKIAPRLLIAITFIVGIVSFLKIRKIDDKTLKKKKIKKTIIIITILIILFVSLLLLPRFLKKY